jgi:CubicO group peptidase (beta-lactamase class C family)
MGDLSASYGTTSSAGDAATLVFQHVERGGLGLDDAVAACRGLHARPPKATPLVTVRDLLPHASGADFDQSSPMSATTTSASPAEFGQGGRRSRVVGEQLIPTMGTPCHSASSDADV